MLLDISCYFPGVEGMGRKLGTNVIMKEPQLLYNGYLKSTQMEKVGLFSQGPLAPPPLRYCGDTPAEKCLVLFR